MGHEDREKKFEQALERYLRRDGAGVRHEADAHADVRDEMEATVACPDAATLAAFHEGMLSSTEMDAAKEHVASCSRCQEVMMQLEATDEIPLEVEPQNVLNAREAALSAGGLHVDDATRQTPSPTIAGQPKQALKAPKDISRGRGFKALRWAVPAGAIAAGLLIWFVARDNKQTLSHFENVQVAQEQPRNERLAAPRPLPASPAPEAVTKSKQLNELRKDGSRVKQPAEESGALRAPKSASSAAITNEVGAVASQAGPRANARQLPAKSRDYSSLEVVENKPPEMSSRQADVSVTAAVEAAPAASGKTTAASGEPRAQSAAPMATPPAAPNGASSNAGKQKSDGDHTSKITTIGDDQAALATEQAATTDKLQSRSLVLIGKAVDAKKILVPGGTVLWRVGAAGRIEQSVDSGATWVPQNSGVKVELLAGSAPSEAVCWIVGRSGTILRTTDGGGHWNKVVSPMGGDVAGVRAVDAMTAEIFNANRSARFVTRDGGASWEAAKE
jgi:hypothetical protein